MSVAKHPELARLSRAIEETVDYQLANDAPVVTELRAAKDAVADLVRRLAIEHGILVAWVTALHATVWRDTEHECHALNSDGKANCTTTRLKELRELVRRLEGERPKCSHCGNPATCFGSYERPDAHGFACDECCGHGCEDGHCAQLQETFEAMPGWCDNLERTTERADELEGERDANWEAGAFAATQLGECQSAITALKSKLRELAGEWSARENEECKPAKAAIGYHAYLHEGRAQSLASCALDLLAAIGEEE